jgi:uracil permease
MLIEKKVDYTKPSNLILTALTFVTGISGAKITMGHVELKGMALATVVAICLGIVVWIGELCGAAPVVVAGTEAEVD